MVKQWLPYFRSLLVLFDYRKGRDSSGPKEMLSGFKEILQTDGYIVYDSLYGNHPDILLTYCMAHARRYFVDAVKDDEKQANYVLDEMQLLYALEQRMREQELDWQHRTPVGFLYHQQNRRDTKTT